MTKKRKSAPARPMTARDTGLGLPKSYAKFLDALKKEISQSRIRAALSVNSELIKLYWNLGQKIVARQETEGWGTKIIEKVASDLTRAFPEMKGFSRTNLFRIRAFYLAYQKVPQAVGQLES